MDSWTTRKRPWEETDDQFEPSEPTTAAGERRAPPLPHHAGVYSRDSQSLSQRRLPPLYTPSCSASARPLLPTSLRHSSPAQDADELDFPRPHYNLLQQPKRPRLEIDTERTTAAPEALDLDLPPIGTPRFSDPTPHAAGVACCSSTCKGPACSQTRTLVSKIASELISLDTKVRSLFPKDTYASHEQPKLERDGTKEDYNDDRASQSPERVHSPSNTSLTMRRGHYPFEREEHSPQGRQPSGPMHGYTGFVHPAPLASDESRRHLYGSDATPMANSPHHTTSSSGSAFIPPQSPMQAPQPSRPSMLPSPSSMNFPNVPNLPPISPPSASMQNSAQAAHLQDLQHQVSIKTLAFQTLQREYDALLQKLERQRTKCATLEKKFEVSDVEINSLTDEKEKLQVQVANLENQVEELQQSRDEARRQLVANGAQYMRIMEMANRLQAQSAEDKRRWEAEKSELEQRIKVLEEAMVTGATERATVHMQQDSGESPPPSTIETHLSSATPTSSAETINVLRGEIGRLRSRTQTLESALHSMKEESISIQAAAKQLVDAGGKLEKVASETASGQR